MDLRTASNTTYTTIHLERSFNDHGAHGLTRFYNSHGISRGAAGGHLPRAFLTLPLHPTHPKWVVFPRLLFAPSPWR